MRLGQVAFAAHVGIISIHAPVKGATYGMTDEFDMVAMISIHAPVKGATW